LPPYSRTSMVGRPGEGLDGGAWVEPDVLISVTLAQRTK
jgi:hypothetical protein